MSKISLSLNAVQSFKSIKSATCMPRMKEKHNNNNNNTNVCLQKIENKITLYKRNHVVATLTMKHRENIHWINSLHGCILVGIISMVPKSLTSSSTSRAPSASMDTICKSLVSNFNFDTVEQIANTKPYPTTKLYLNNIILNGMIL